MGKRESRFLGAANFIVSPSRCDLIALATSKERRGKSLMKFVKFAAVAAFAVASLGLSACASKPAPAPAPATMGTMK
jgi:hypothetical protein